MDVACRFSWRRLQDREKVMLDELHSSEAPMVSDGRPAVILGMINVGSLRIPDIPGNLGIINDQWSG